MKAAVDPGREGPRREGPRARVNLVVLPVGNSEPTDGGDTAPGAALRRRNERTDTHRHRAERDVKTRARVTSSVIFVAEVDRSVEFYSGLFGCNAVIHDRDAALLVGPEGFQIYLIGQGPRAPHHSGGIGPQCLIWAVDSAEELTDVERALQSLGIRTDHYTSGGVAFVAGRDPDGIRILVAHPSPEELPRSVIGARLYS